VTEVCACGPVALVDGEAFLIPHLFTRQRADAYLAELLEDVAWQQQVIRIGGRRVASPRLSAWYGDPGADYAYSGLSLEPIAWSPLLAEIKGEVERASGAVFNSVLANLYRDGADSMGWHSDDEPELGERPLIASASFGATRRFRLRHRQRRDLEPVALPLNHGSLLVMKGSTQANWKHQVPKKRPLSEPRVNLTFRTILR
jgi:alkylated DNA repair dioxygenase AlkB